MEYWQKIRKKVGSDKIIFTGSAVAVLDDLNRVLLQKRSDKDCWGFPGGLMDEGESFEETAVREVREETGLEIKICDLVGIYSKYEHSFPNSDRIQPVIVLFTGKVTGGELHCDMEETLDLRYFAFDEKPELLNKQHEDAFDDLFDFLKNKNVKIR